MFPVRNKIVGKLKLIFSNSSGLKKVFIKLCFHRGLLSMVGLKPYNKAVFKFLWDSVDGPQGEDKTTQGQTSISKMRVP